MSATIERDGKLYRSGTLTVAPIYNADLLAALYLQIRAEGKLPLVFYESGEEGPGVKWWLNWCETSGTTVIGCWRGTQLLVSGWVNDRKRLSSSGFTRAEIGFCCFDGGSIWEKLEGGRLILTWAFENLCIDVMNGSTPEHNPSAVAYAKRLGMCPVAEIPFACRWKDEPCAAVITQLLKEQIVKEN